MDKKKIQQKIISIMERYAQEGYIYLNSINGITIKDYDLIFDWSSYPQEIAENIVVLRDMIEKYFFTYNYKGFLGCTSFIVKKEIYTFEEIMENIKAKKFLGNFCDNINSFCNYVQVEPKTFNWLRELNVEVCANGNGEYTFNSNGKIYSVQFVILNDGYEDFKAFDFDTITQV